MATNTQDAPRVPQEVQVSIRLPQSFIDRAQALVDRLRQNPDNVVMGVTRTTVLRLALSRGLDALEAEILGAPADRKSEPKAKARR